MKIKSLLAQYHFPARMRSVPQLSKPEPAQSSRCCHHQRVSIPAARGHRSLPSRAQQSRQDRHHGRLSPKQTASQMKLRTSSIWPRNKSTVLQRHQQPAARDALIYARPSNLLFSEENGNHSVIPKTPAPHAQPHTGSTGDYLKSALLAGLLYPPASLG